MISPDSFLFSSMSASRARVICSLVWNRFRGQSDPTLVPTPRRLDPDTSVVRDATKLRPRGRGEPRRGAAQRKLPTSRKQRLLSICSEKRRDPARS
jgi:hypothetical protein